MTIPVLLMARQLDIGGSERQMTETAKALDCSVFEPHVGCFRPVGMRGDELRRAGVPVVQFPVGSFRKPPAIRGVQLIARYIREHGIRIVHTWDYPLATYAVPIARLLTKAFAISSQRGHRNLTPPLYRRWVRVTDRMAHAIVVNCEYLRRHLAEDEHVAPGKIHICYNGIDLEHFRRLEMPPHPLTLGTVCALRPEKDLQTLIRAFARVAKSAADTRLVIVGSGPEQAVLQQYAREASVGERCRFEPATPRVADWLNSIDVFVLPSRSEALSNSLMEAMACGCCAVASEVGGNPELIRPNETGLLFRAGDDQALAAALISLIEQPALRLSLAARGESFLRANFSLAAAARRMGEIYSSVVS
jgi:L-malate glycosyltransferase